MAVCCSAMIKPRSDPGLLAFGSESIVMMVMGPWSHHAGFLLGKHLFKFRVGPARWALRGR